MWCWRCKAKMPMLDETEYAVVHRLYMQSIQGVKELRRKTGIALQDPSVHDLYRPVRERYEQITGMQDCHQDAILHHRISLYGPPCERCKKPLRRPRAKMCGACMFPAGEPQG